MSAQGSRAFAPGSISGVFKIIPDDDPACMHSLGFSLTISEGVTTVVGMDDRSCVSFNGEQIEFPTVNTVINMLTEKPIRVSIESPLPLSCGFGLSGASAITTAYAVGAFLGLGRSQRDLAMVAHTAEVENLTGLGDVCAQYHGGCLVKLTPGEALGAERLGIAERPIYYRYFSPISTREVLSDPVAAERINGAADLALQALGQLREQEDIELNACIDVCRDFVRGSGLMRDEVVRKTIDDIQEAGGSSSMIMLGNAVFSTRPFSGASAAMLSMGKARLL